MRLVGRHRQQAAFAQLQPLPAQSPHLQFGGNAGQVQVVGAIHLHRQPGVGTHACAPIQPARADGQAGTVRSAVRHLIATLVLVARYRGTGLADAVLQLPAERGAVAFVVVATQLARHFAVLVFVFLAQGLAGAVVDVRSCVLRLAHIQAVAPLRTAAVTALQAVEAEVEIDAAVTPIAQAAATGLLPHADAAGNTELAPALAAAVAGLPGAAELRHARGMWNPRRQQRVQPGQWIIPQPRLHGACAPGLATGVGQIGIAARHRQRHRGAERVGTAEPVARVVLELAGAAAQALVVHIPRGAATVGQLVLLATAAVAAVHAAEGAADLLGGEHMAQVQPQFAIAEAAEVGDTGRHCHVARHRHAQAGHRCQLVVETVAAALVTAAALHEPLHAAVGPVTALVEWRVLAAHQYAVFVDAQGDGVVAQRKPARIELVDTGLQVEGLQQALAIERIHPCIACQQHGERRGLYGGRRIHVGLRGAQAQALEAVHRQHAEAEGAALRTAQVAAVHAPGLQVVLLPQVMAVIGVVQLEVAVGAAAAIVLLAEGPIGRQVPALQHAQRAHALRGQRLVAAAAADVERVLVQEGIFGIGADLVVALGGRFAGNPLAGDEQAHGALAFVIQRAHGGGLLGGIDVTAAGAGATVTAGQMAVAWQRLRQRGQQRGLCLGGQLQCLQCLRRCFQLHVLQGHAHRHQPG